MAWSASDTHSSLFLTFFFFLISILPVSWMMALSCPKPYFHSTYPPSLRECPSSHWRILVEFIEWCRIEKYTCRLDKYTLTANDRDIKKLYHCGYDTWCIYLLVFEWDMIHTYNVLFIFPLSLLELEILVGPLVSSTINMQLPFRIVSRLLWRTDQLLHQRDNVL